MENQPHFNLMIKALKINLLLFYAVLLNTMPRYKTIAGEARTQF